MVTSDLDNPVWASLRSTHRALAQVSGGVARYPADVAPFLAVETSATDVQHAIAALVGDDETVYLLGVVPGVPAGWSPKAYAELAQMECIAPIEAIDGPQAMELGVAHHADVMALTALVYPHYFRPRTTDMGRYFGIYQQGRLAAMIGERMGADACREISAVCTHPDFTGRGYARQLLARLSNDILEHGMTPFLHVSHENRRAKDLYLQVGYRLRRDIGFWSLRRT